MQWLAETCVKRPVFALMLTLAMLVAGVVAYPQLGVDRFPNLDLPTLSVQTSYPGAAPEEVESEVTDLIEDAVATVAGIEELRSISSDSSSIILVTFVLTRDIDTAAEDVRDAVTGILNRLPRGIDPPIVRKSDTDSSPIMSLAVSGPRESRELYQAAEKAVKNVIESAPGVGRVSITGAMSRAVKVQVDARRLAAYGLSILQVREALVRQNAETPGGRVDAGSRELSLRTMGRVDRVQEFADLVLETVGGTTVRLGDVAEIVDGQKEMRNLARMDGSPAVVLFVQRQSGENTIRVIEGVRERLARCRELLPPDVTLTVIQDQSRYVAAAMEEIQKHLVIGSMLASLVVLVFMKSWQSTLIAALAIPTSIVATFAVMKGLGFTLNNVTMLALVLMVGVVIDDAIVVLENIYHRLQRDRLSPAEAAIEGTREIGLAVLATTLSLVIVFLPVSFLASVTGRMLYQFGLTASISVLVSMVVSFSLTPMLCSRWLKPQPVEHEPTAGGLYAAMERAYLWCLGWSLRHRMAMLTMTAVVIAANVPLYRWIRQDYIPTNVDESEFEVGVAAPEGASLAAMDSVMQSIESELVAIDGVQHVLASIGSRGLGSVNRGDFYVRLKDAHERTWSIERFCAELFRGTPWAAWEGNFSQRQKMLEVRQRLARFSDCRLSVRNLTSLRQGAPVDIDFSVTGPSLEVLGEYTERLRQTVSQLPGIVDADTTLRTDKPQLLVQIDRGRAAALGVDAQEISDTLRIAVGGDDRVSRYRDRTADDAFDVELRLVGLDRGDPESMAQLNVRARSRDVAAPGVEERNRTALTRLDNVADFEVGYSPARIDRLDRERMVAVRTNVSGGYALGDRINAIRDASVEVGLPPGCRTRVLGRGKELEKTLQDFMWMILLSFVFMYLVLAAQFEHLVHPLTILASLPLAAPFGLLSLWLCGETLNLYSALGILVLFGVVKKNAILQVDHTNQLRAGGMSREAAILQANRDRLRPILMTTIAFVAGMLPLLFGTGPGAEERRSIAVLAVGGQSLSLLLTLLAIPVLYSVFDDVGAVLVGWGSRAAVPAAVPQAR